MEKEKGKLKTKILLGILLICIIGTIIAIAGLLKNRSKLVYILDLQEDEITSWEKHYNVLSDRYTTLSMGVEQLTNNYERDLGIWIDKSIQLQEKFNDLKDDWTLQYNALRRWEKWKIELDKKTDTPVVIVEPQEPNFTDIVQESIKSVVHIMCPEWQGSGFVITPNIIATARHVSEKVESFDITTNEGHKLHATRAISSKKYDISLIYIDDLTCVAEKERELECKKVTHKVKLVPAKLGSIKDCKLGQQVYTIGSPYGKMNFNAMSLGIISGLDRDWDMVDSYTGERYGWEVAFTTDSAGHPGNSGCPVFTMDGKVRGILVGGFSPVLIGVMPCDLFLPDLEIINDMFIQDKYYSEKVPDTRFDEMYDWFTKLKEANSKLYAFIELLLVPTVK